MGIDSFDFIGRYNNIEEAQDAYIKAHKEIFGKFSVYNRPIGD